MIPKRLLYLTILLLVSPAAGAEGLIGLGFVNNVTGINLEWTFDSDSFYAVPGYYFKSNGAETETFSWVAGYRHRLNGGSMDTDGFYAGLLAGDLNGKERSDRRGAGGELGYQWVADYTRWTLSMGLAALEAEDDVNRNTDTEPEAFLAFSISIR